jgi:4-carboxymuconolactone decarboxylase
MADSSRFDRGAQVLEQLFGFRPTSEQTTDDFARVTIENLFGDVWSRPGLALRDRSLATVSALTVLGREAELRQHLTGALRMGITREQIRELMLQLAHYGGWPVAVMGLRVAADVFAAADKASEGQKSR